jgi:hypothetical protein
MKYFISVTICIENIQDAHLLLGLISKVLGG